MCFLGTPLHLGCGIRLPRQSPPHSLSVLRHIRHHSSAHQRQISVHQCPSVVEIYIFNFPLSAFHKPPHAAAPPPSVP
jgi:hypothetical protein